MLIASTGSSNPVMRERKRNSARWWSKVDETAKTEKSTQRKNKKLTKPLLPKFTTPKGFNLAATPSNTRRKVPSLIPKSSSYSSESYSVINSKHPN